MLSWFSTSFSLLLKGSAFLLLVNELRGLILAGPVLYALFRAGGSILALWIGFCSLAGIGLSVIVPLVAASKLQNALQPRSPAARAGALSEKMQ